MLHKQIPTRQQLRRAVRIAMPEAPGLLFIRHFVRLAYLLQFPVIAVSIILLLFTLIFANVMSPLFFTGGLALLGIVLMYISFPKTRSDLQFSIRLFSFVFFFSIAVTCLIYLYYIGEFGVPYESGGTDDARLEYQAYEMIAAKVTSYQEAKLVFRSTGTGTWNDSGNYVILVSLVHATLDALGNASHTLNPRILNSFFLALTAIAVWRVAKRGSQHESTARFAGYYAGLLPSFVFVAAHIYRDTLIGLGITLVVLLTITLPERFRSAYTTGRALPFTFSLIGLLASWLLVTNLRDGIDLILIGMMGMMILVVIQSPRRTFIFLALAIIVVGIVFYIGWFNQFLYRAGILVDYYTEYRANSGAADGIGTGIYRLPPLLSYPLRIAYAAITPLPFPSVYLSEDFRRLGTIVWILSLPFLLSTIIKSLKRPTCDRDYYRRALVVAFLCMFLPVAMVTLQSRQITMYGPIAAVLIATGIESSRRPILIRWFPLIGFGILAVILYSAWKLFL